LVWRRAADGSARRAASFPLIGFLSTHGLSYVITGIAVIIAIAVIAATQVGTETPGRALDEIAPTGRVAMPHLRTVGVVRLNHGPRPAPG
jgi:hypothetical protein